MVFHTTRLTGGMESRKSLHRGKVGTRRLFGLQTTTIGHTHTCQKSPGKLSNTEPVVELVDVAFGSHIHSLAFFHTSLPYSNVPLGTTT